MHPRHSLQIYRTLECNFVTWLINNKVEDASWFDIVLIKLSWFYVVMSNWHFYKNLLTDIKRAVTSLSFPFVFVMYMNYSQELRTYVE